MTKRELIKSDSATGRNIERKELLNEARVSSYQRRLFAIDNSRIIPYFVALVIGLSAALYMFPQRVIFASDIFDHPVLGMDAAVHVIGQRYFIQDHWSWPLLVVKSLVPPDGTNIAFTDSIPLIALVTKLFRHLLPRGFTSVFLWLAFCWVLQPVAAVFALRSTGERRVLPGVALALIAVSMPTLLFRYVHAALCSHFIILIALGLYLRMVRRVQFRIMIAAELLMVAALLVNPYILYMVIAVLAASPLTLLLKRDRAWIPAATSLLLGIILIAILAVLLGYSRALPMSGFDLFSMNLISPLYPFGSAIFRGFLSPVDATGGQYEGYQYLGLGVLLLIAVAEFSLGPRAKVTLVRRHAGLFIVCCALTFFSLSSTVYAGSHLLFRFKAPDWVLQLRVPGRFFWPVAYTAVIAGVAIVSRALTRTVAAIVLLVVSLFQFADANLKRKEVRRAFRHPQIWSLDTKELRPLLAEHSKLTIWPKFFCGVDSHAPAFTQLLLLASEVNIPVNTMYVGRFTSPTDCSLPEAPIKIGGDELLILAETTPATSEHTAATLLSITDWRNICRRIGVLVTCSEKLRGRDDLPIPEIRAVTLAKYLSTGTDGAGDYALGSGWSVTEPWGVWSDGSVAQIVAKISDAGKPILLTVQAHAYVDPPETTQQVTVSANGQLIAVWNIDGAVDSEYKALIPPPSTPDQPLLINFHIRRPIAPRQAGLGSDDRKLGIGLVRFRLDQQPSEQKMKDGIANRTRLPLPATTSAGHI